MSDPARLRRVLVVEDSATIRHLIVSFLEEEGYAVSDAEDGPAAMASLAELIEPIDVLLCDVSLPGDSGPMVASQIRELQPDVSIIFMSGDDLKLVAGLEDDFRFLAKPFRLAELSGIVAEALA